MKIGKQILVDPKQTVVFGGTDIMVLKYLSNFKDYHNSLKTSPTGKKTGERKVRKQGPLAICILPKLVGEVLFNWHICPGIQFSGHLLPELTSS